MAPVIMRSIDGALPMATYTHFEATPTNPFGDPADSWVDVMGSSFSSSSTMITIANSDGTLTEAHGAFTLVGNVVSGGIITSLDRTSSDGITTYESITGTAIDAFQFLTATAAGKLAGALSGADNLFGYSGDDLLNGYGGADHMFGGAGNDVYVVDNVNDVVTEFAHQGNDSIYTSLSGYTLPANVENLNFTTTASHTGFGNGLDNNFSGGAGHDTFYGLGGNDSFDGLGGGDTFYGGTGNDSYNVVAGDTVIEQANEGIDTVITSLSNYVIPDNIENLSISAGSGPAYGNALDNVIGVNGGSGMTVYGFGGNDTLASTGGNDWLIGGDGNDRLIASYGHDTLTGGNDDDTFVIEEGNHIITDFAAGPGVHDRIDLADFKPGHTLAGATTFHNFSDVLAHATQNGANTSIDLGAGNSLTLNNVLKSDLSADDFVWAQTPKDFKGDTVSDILWHNDNGANSIWDNGQIGGAHALNSAGGVDASWHIAGSGDFDKDGSADILWHNDNGAVSIWDNGDINQAHVIAAPGTVDSSWHIAGVADFDGNGQSDILWHNDNGAASIWNSGNINQANVIAKAGDVAASWHIAGTGDFDGNGHDDILWQNDNGAASIWDNGNINKAHIIANPGQVADNWHIAGTGDFDGNGHDDILWHNDNGAVSIWDNGNINQAHIIADAGAVASSWHIAGTGDYDGNRQTDIVWHNDNGAVSIWDNGQIGNAHVVATGIDASWHIA
jgi:Ca2+-binding RTX toxin-like protein